MSKATLTVEGFVAKDPEVREHQGRPVVNVTVPHTPRKRDGHGGYEDAGPTLWVQASFWDDMAVTIAGAVGKGTLVTITGQPELRVFTKQDGSTDAQLQIKFGTLAVIPRGEAPQGQGAPNTVGTGDWSPTAPPSPQDASGGFSAETPF